MRILLLGGMLAVLLGRGEGLAQEIGYTVGRAEKMLREGIPVLYPLRISENPYITSLFGWRRHPLDGIRLMHYGVDLACPRGFQFVHATAGGTVAHAGEQAGMGKSVTIAHPSGFVSGYGHLSELYVRRGDTVQAGEVIGVMGQTGRANGVHLHYSLRWNGRWVDPLPYLMFFAPAENKKDAYGASGAR